MACSVVGMKRNALGQFVRPSAAVRSRKHRVGKLGLPPWKTGQKTKTGDWIVRHETRTGEWLIARFDNHSDAMHFADDRLYGVQGPTRATTPRPVRNPSKAGPYYVISYIEREPRDVISKHTTRAAAEKVLAKHRRGIARWMEANYDGTPGTAKGVRLIDASESPDIIAWVTRS